MFERTISSGTRSIPCMAGEKNSTAKEKTGKRRLFRNSAASVMPTMQPPVGVELGWSY